MNMGETMRIDVSIEVRRKVRQPAEGGVKLEVGSLGLEPFYTAPKVAFEIFEIYEFEKGTLGIRVRNDDTTANLRTVAQADAAGLAVFHQNSRDLDAAAQHRAP